MPNKFSTTAFCSSHLPRTLTPPLTPLFPLPSRLVHGPASHVSAGGGRCRFTGQVQRRWERPAHQLRTDNHITRRPCSQIPSVTLVQIHAAPQGWISVREEENVVLSMYPIALGKEPESITLHQCRHSLMLLRFSNQRL